MLTASHGSRLARLLLSSQKRMFSFESGPISDPYYILEVPRTATIKEVKKAYFHKAKKYHPDLNPNNDSAKKMFIEI